MYYDFATFAERTALEDQRAYVDMPYIHAMCEAVEDCIAGCLPGGKKNLAIAIPPRHYKTTYISQTFPAWCFAEVAPDCEFILTSATDKLAKNNAIMARKILDAAWYQELYPHVKVSSSDKDEQGYFKTTSTGSLYAAGLGGTITGFGAGKVREGFGGAIIIDDPLKADDASSDTMRQKSIDYYVRTLKSRRNSVYNTPFILIMQRLHPDDLIGWVLRNEPEDWHLVSFPAIQDGKLLNPLTTSLRELETLKEVDPGTFYAQYQQTPMVAGGNIIKLDWWRTFDPTTRHGGMIFLTADTAFKAEKKHDASVIQVWEGTQHALYCLDSIYGRWEFPQLLQNAKEFWDQWQAKGAKEFWVEDKASGTPLEQMLSQVGVPAQAWNPREFEYPDDKVARMRSASWGVHGGMVYLPEGNEVVRVGEDKEVRVAMHAKVLMEEAAAFAADMSHAHDDHCDAFTMADSLWRQAGGGR